ncbi:pseudouridine synthase [Pholiota conissans]|uniref:Pseudouridine synthase n=1 Tax=Pholiota conissans TaxID=109636 RepID=A0A9P5YSH5_9AGAR|nr:pseudouridine synthase [Pholiota conissans]
MAGEKRRVDNAPGDVHSEAKRARLDEVPIAFSSALGASTPLTGNTASGDACTDVNLTSTVEETKKQEPRSKRPDRRNQPKEKGRGRGGRRTRNEEDAAKEEQSTTEGDPIPKAPRYPKRQCSLFIGFCGSGYSGMQMYAIFSYSILLSHSVFIIRQPDHTRTIEGVLFNALVKVGAVSQDNADNPTKVALARAARTDAGVHAAGNIVSLKMIVTIPGVKDLVARINEELPPEIRLWGYGRTQNSFNARLSCDSRKYTYFFPTYLLVPPKPGSGLHRVWAEHAAIFPDAVSKLPISYDFWEGRESSTQEEDMLRKRSWRIKHKQVETLRTLAKKYEGTHNFHNFTVSRDFSDRSNNRYMKKIEVADPVVYGDTEWISVLFHGQSFMLHQRKMMAILVLGCRMGTSPRIISELYGQRSVFVPKMPSLGLLLEEPLFNSYNEKIAAINAKLKPTDPEYRPLIDFDVHREKMNAFKEIFIYKNMREVEDRDGLFDAWVRMIDAYAGNDLLYLNPTGAVPEAAVIKQGEKRANPFREKKIFDTTNFPADGIKKDLQEETLELEEEEEEEEEEDILDKSQLAETEG